MLKMGVGWLGDASMVEMNPPLEKKDPTTTQPFTISAKL